MCCVFPPVFDPHSAVCRGGGGGGEWWHHGRCAGNAKTARNHPRCSHHQLHNIGHVDLASRVLERRWSLLAAHGWTGGLEEGLGGCGGWWWGSSASARIAHWQGGLLHHHLLHCHLWPTCPPAIPQVRNPPVPRGISVTHAQISVLPAARHICFPHIFVFLVYLSRPNICHSPMFLSITYLFLGVVVFPGH